MKKNCRYFLTSLFILLIMCIPFFTNAQIAGGGCDPLDPLCPIDGGLSFLLAAGVGYGIKKVHSSRKKNASAI